MKILLLGKNGQLGWELQRSLAPLGELLSLSSESSKLCGELSNLEGIAATVRQFKPDVIVNAAAYTAVDKAESEPDLAHRVNAEAVAVLAQEAKALGCLFVHFSTDYVFPGFGEQAWCENDAVAPLNTYGATKLAGECAIQQSGCLHLIFRTSWVYAARGQNFAKTILRLAQERDALSVIADQVGAPTGAELLADVTAHAIRAVLQDNALSGLYHLAAKGETNWYEYAQFVLAIAEKNGCELKVKPADVTAISSCDYKTDAKRPENSRLNTDKLQQAFAIHLPHWKVGVERMLDEVLAAQ